MSTTATVIVPLDRRGEVEATGAFLAITARSQDTEKLLACKLEKALRHITLRLSGDDAVDELETAAGVERELSEAGFDLISVNVTHGMSWLKAPKLRCN